MPATLKAGAALWASGRIGGGHILSLFPVVSAGLYGLRALLCCWAGIHKAPGVLIVFGGRWGCCCWCLRASFTVCPAHSQDGGRRGVGSTLSLRRASASAHCWAGCFLCALFDACCLLSLVAPLLCCAGGGPGACGCTSVHLSRCVQSGLGVVAGALGGDAGSILLEDSRQALFGGPLAWGVAARSWLGGAESCLQPSRQASLCYHAAPLWASGAEDWGWAHLVVVSCCFGGLIH